MNKKDLYEHSPIRCFDKITDGGLKEGEIGLITSKKGLGKTSVLVQFGLDALLADKKLLHVTFDQHSSNTISWYASVFSEIAKKKNINNASELKEEIMRERTILNFNPENFTMQKVVNTVNALSTAGIKVSALVIDGYEMKNVTEEDFNFVAEFAKKENVAIWITSTQESDKLADSAAAGVLAKLACVVHLEAQNGGVSLNVLKLREATPNTSLKLDSKTLLISEK